MALPDLACPVCDADLVLSGDEDTGDLVYCTFCGAPCVLSRKPEQDDESAWEVEEDW